MGAAAGKGATASLPLVIDFQTKGAMVQ